MPLNAKHLDTAHHSPLEQLRAIMATLRNPNGGCPWDLEQNFATIAPYTIEEAYEVADAIARGDMAELKDELGDLLLQVVFHSQMAAEAGLFTFDDVAQSVSDKMIRRHPHVFADAEIKTAEAQTASWETIKAAERRAKQAASSTLPSAASGEAGASTRLSFASGKEGSPTLPSPAGGGGDALPLLVNERSAPPLATHLSAPPLATHLSAPPLAAHLLAPPLAGGMGGNSLPERTLDNIPTALPALMRAQKLQSRAARVGFDWPEISGVIAKIREELSEVEEALHTLHACHPERSEGSDAASHPPATPQDDKKARDHVGEEIGDLLFAVTNLARFTGHDAESALRSTNAKFTRRFEYIEDQLRAVGKTPADASLNEMGALWDAAKELENT